MLPVTLKLSEVDLIMLPFPNHRPALKKNGEKLPLSCTLSEKLYYPRAYVNFRILATYCNLCIPHQPLPSREVPDFFSGGNPFSKQSAQNDSLPGVKEHSHKSLLTFPSQMHL